MEKEIKEFNVPKIRYPGFSDPWEQCKLKDSNTTFTDGNYGESYPKPTDMITEDEGVPFLTGGNIKDGRLIKTGASYISKNKHEELISGHLLYDDIVIAVRGSLGVLGYVNKLNIGWNINSQLAIIRTDKRIILGNYLIYYLLTERGKKEILSRQTGTALKQLSIKSLSEVIISYPKLEEQRMIGPFFQRLDDAIALHQRKIDLLKDYKNGMLQKMFPKNETDIPDVRYPEFTDPWEQRKFGEIYKNQRKKMTFLLE